MNLDLSPVPHLSFTGITGERELVVNAVLYLLTVALVASFTWLGFVAVTTRHDATDG